MSVKMPDLKEKLPVNKICQPYGFAINFEHCFFNLKNFIVIGLCGAQIVRYLLITDQAGKEI